jgi:hypothetical protein
MKCIFELVRIYAEYYGMRVSQKLETIELTTVNAVNVSYNVTKLVNSMLKHVCSFCMYSWTSPTVLISTTRCHCKMYRTKHWTCQTVGGWGWGQRVSWGQWEIEVVSRFTEGSGRSRLLAGLLRAVGDWGCQQVYWGKWEIEVVSRFAEDSGRLMLSVVLLKI